MFLELGQVFRADLGQGRQGRARMLVSRIGALELRGASQPRGAIEQAKPLPRRPQPADSPGNSAKFTTVRSPWGRYRKPSGSRVPWRGALGVARIRGRNQGSEPTVGRVTPSEFTACCRAPALALFDLNYPVRLVERLRDWGNDAAHADQSIVSPCRVTSVRCPADLGAGRRLLCRSPDLPL